MFGFGQKKKTIPTEQEKQAELKRVVKTSGFCVGAHEFMAEVDFDTLKKRNDQWEAEHRNQPLQDRKVEEFIRIAAYVALKHAVYHIQIHIHAAHEAGATPEEIYSLIDRVGSWASSDAQQNGMEAWRLVFRPDLPSLFRVTALTSDSFQK